MSQPKIHRSQSREAALQILFCQSFADADMARAIAAVQSVRTIEAFQSAIRALGETRRAADQCTQALNQAIEALTEASSQPGRRKKVAATEEGTLTTRLDVEETRAAAIEELRKTTTMLQSTAILFDEQGFCRRLLKTFDKHREEIDSVINRSLEGWTLRRLIGEDAGVLRLGVTELLFFKEIPAKVILNEYIELARQYGENESPRLVNGVLDRVLQDHPREEEAPAGKE